MTKTNPADWLKMAKDDLLVAGDAQTRRIYHLACFHAQQAAEKLLKAILSFYDKEIPKVHSLIELYSLALPLTPDLEQFKQSLKILDRYYIPTRYPDALPGSLEEGLPIEEDAAQAISDVEELFRFVEKVGQ